MFYTHNEAPGKAQKHHARLEQATSLFLFRMAQLVLDDTMALNALSGQVLPVSISNTCLGTSSPNVLAKTVTYHQIPFLYIEVNLGFAVPL